MIRSGATERRRVLMPFIAAFLALTLLGPVAGAASAADPCPNAEVRAQQGASRLPECRAYEMVSPPHKNGNAVLGGIAPTADGSAFAYWAPGAFSGALSSVGVNYVARRGPGGWTTSAINLPFSGRNPGLFDAPVAMDFDEDFSRALIETQYPLFPDDPDRGARDDLFLREPDGSFEWTTGGAAPRGDGTQGRASYAGSSSDLEHVVFEAERSYDSGIPADTTVEHVYEAHDGQVRLVNRDSNGDPMLAGAHVGIGIVVSDPFADHSTAVSPDGSRIVFTSPPDNTSGQVYIRIDGITTVQVSATQKDPPDVDPPRGSTYRDATPDTSKVLFSSADSLTNDSVRGENVGDHTLYLYDVESGELKNVSPYDPSVPPEEQTDGPGVRGTAGMSADGSRVFFTATGRLIDDPRAVAGEFNLYMYDAATDSVRWLGILDFNEGEHRRSAAVTPSGENLLVLSTRALDGGSQTGEQLYRYDVSDDDWTCVSCSAHGSGLGTDPFDGVEYRAYGIPHGRISADGRRVFFNTSVALLPEDNNTAPDPYMWLDGQLYLLSSGRSPHPSVWVGSTPDGSSAFILTNESLSGHDVDNGVADAYAVRTGGGFPEPQDAQICTTDCRPPASPPPASQEPGSTTFHGNEGAPLAPRASFSVARLGRAQRARLARGRAVELRVRVNRAGRVGLTARARLGGRLRVVGRDSARASRAGTVTLDLRLAKAARRRLARGHALRVTVSVKFAGVREPARLSLRLAR